MEGAGRWGTEVRNFRKVTKGKDEVMKQIKKEERERKRIRKRKEEVE